MCTALATPPKAVMENLLNISLINSSLQNTCGRFTTADLRDVHPLHTSKGKAGRPNSREGEAAERKG